MGRSIEGVGVNPAMLVYSRQQLRMSEAVAAEKVGVPVDRLKRWEAGDELPTVAQLRSAAAAYRTPVATFWRQAVPEGDRSLPDRRSLPSGEAAEVAFTIELRQARELRRVYIELDSTLIERGRVTIPINPTTQVSSAAERLRASLGVSIEQQRHAAVRDPDYGNLSLWRTAAEEMGVLVVGFPHVPLSSARGFADYYDAVPIIGLNNSDTPTARLFTLCHEMVHIALRSSSRCDLAEDTDETERFCNAVAGSTLVPDDQLSSWSHGASSADIAGFARSMGVSRAVVARRLLDLGKVTETEYRRLHSIYNKPTSGESNSGGTHYRNVLVRIGRPFARTVIRAYSDGRITLADAAAHLRVKTNRIDKIPNYMEIARILCEGEP